MMRKQYQRQTREESCAALASATLRPVTSAVMATIADMPKKQAPKVQGRVIQALRDSARGEECQIRLDGVCLGTTDTTVWCHWPGIDAGRGMGLKALDLCGAYGCFACHNVLDGRAHVPGFGRQEIALAFLHGHMRSLVRAWQKGVL